MTYARARLWIGISGVGTFVTLSAVILAFGVTPFTVNDGSLLSSITMFALFVLGYVAVAAPFDWVGGYVLPKRYGRLDCSRFEFFTTWSRGVLWQSFLLLLTALVLMSVARAFGTLAAGGALGGIALFFFSFQMMFARLIAPLKITNGDKSLDDVKQSLEQLGYPPLKLSIASSSDQGFTGGIIGLLGMETIVIPAKWIEILSPSQLTAVVARRAEAVISNARTKGLILATIWNVLGFSLILAVVPNAGLKTGGELIITSCSFTLWTFLGLLILPTASRKAAMFLDQEIVNRGVPEADLQSALKAIDQCQDDEPSRSAIIETIFHPVPSLSKRVPNQSSSWPTWHLARTALSCSWIGLGLLGRSVHCNAGRPDLWVLLPTD